MTQLSKKNLIPQLFVIKLPSLGAEKNVRCPALLLLDEIFAPLDPTSKAVVSRKLASACAHSMILAIYNPDTEGSDGDAADVCDAGVGFFEGVVAFVPMAKNETDDADGTRRMAVSLARLCDRTSSEA